MGSKYHQGPIVPMYLCTLEIPFSIKYLLDPLYYGPLSFSILSSLPGRLSRHQKIRYSIFQAFGAVK